MIKTAPLSQVADYSEERVDINDVSLEDFVTVDNMLPNKGGIVVAENIPPYGAKLPRYSKENILVGNIRPYLKKIWFSNRSGGAAADVLIFKVKPGFYPKYVYYAMFRDDFFVHMMRGKKGTKMPRGDKDQILDFLIPKVNYTTQRKIASVLSVLDAKIEFNNRINAELEAMAKTLYDYWFVQFDFSFDFAQGKPNAKGKPYKSSGGKMVWNKELKREIPVGWEVSEIRKFITINRGVSYSGKDITGNGVPMINLNSFNVNSTYKPEGIKTFSGRYEETKVLKPFDLVMCNTQQTALDPKKDIIGKSFLIPDIFESDIVSSHHVTTITVKKEILKYYLNSLFNTEYFHRYISGYATGTNILGLDSEGVYSCRIAIPNDDLLVKYKTIIINIEKQKSRIKRENKTLANLRDWLLPMLMNGQVKVK